MTRTARTLTTLVALLATGALVALSGASAVAASSDATGGSSAPAGGASGAPRSSKAHPGAIATWFGPGLYGQQTACGQTLTPLVLGLANRTLPCGTLVQVSYHGRVATLPVIDRGPYSHIGASWDITAHAAELLGIEDTVRIVTRVVGSAPNTPTLGAPSLSPQALAAGGAQAG
ncbi:MAG TPA: septal ring lytic transglycosylase RlpA family protein [Solirubrobacteraceae bacterium]|nr:septal ring lytic transglycosylase RlpA family protein [Solirubrobacteraceae bacterium]